MQTSAHEGLERLLRVLVDSSPGIRLPQRWARGEGSSVRQVDGLLKLAGWDRDAITAQTLAVKLDTFERFERMILNAKARRNEILREIDRRRDVLARRLRDLTTEIEDAEFQEIVSEDVSE